MDLIDRQAAIDGVKKIPDLSVYAYCSFVDMLFHLPSAEPVRCKECKFYDHFWNGDWCSLKNIDVEDANDFCSRAERRTDE